MRNTRNPMNQRACVDRMAPQPGLRARGPVVPTQCSTAFVMAVDGKKFAARARKCINVRVLAACPRNPGCVPAAPTKCSTAFSRTVDGKKFATRAMPYTHVRVLFV